LFEQNSDWLSQHDPECLIELANLKPKSYEVVPAKKSGLTLALDGAWVHSKYAPAKEAQQVIAAHGHPNQGIHLHLGLGLGYLLEADPLLQSDGLIVAYEPDPNLLLTLLHSRDLAEICAQRRVRFCCTEERLKHLLREGLKQYDQIYTISHPYHRKHCVTPLKQALKRVQQEIDKRTLFGAGFDSQVRRVLTASLQTLPYSWHAPGLTGLYGSLKQVPAVVVMPGPSLAQNLSVLRAFQERVAIFSVARSLASLERMGIAPHFLVHNEPQPLTHLFENRSNLGHTRYLLAEQCHPSLHQHARHKAYIYQNPTNTLSQFLIKHFPEKGLKAMLVSGGTVATEAFVIALLLGCNPVILIGQDLALTGGNYYVKDGGNAAFQHSDREYRVVPAYFGGQVQTLKHYAHFIDWYRDALPTLKQKFPGVRMINATEGGAELQGFHAESLHEALARYAYEPQTRILSKAAPGPHLAKPLPNTLLRLLQAEQSATSPFFQDVLTPEVYAGLLKSIG
jgi:hypothetical protein